MIRRASGIAILLATTHALGQSQYPLPGSNGPGGVAAVYGTWGTAAQCAHPRDDSTGIAHMQPYEISAQWIRQGWFHCYLTWLGQSNGDGGLEALALAQCGEDLLRDYRIVLSLREERLQIHWSADYSTPELRVCEASSSD